jgi:AcrR family transcriptional regulator
MSRSPASDKRVYESPLRAARAADTVARVLTAAERSFSTRGFASTKMKDIAEEAGVSVETVYAIGNKKKLILRVMERVLVGGDSSVSLLEDPVYRSVLARTDPYLRIEGFVAFFLREFSRFARIFWPFEHAAQADAEVHAEYLKFGEQMYLIFAQLPASLAADGLLRPGLELSVAADLVWVLASPAAVHALTQVRQWSNAEMVDRMTDALVQILL